MAKRKKPDDRQTPPVYAAASLTNNDLLSSRYMIQSADVELVGRMIRNTVARAIDLNATVVSSQPLRLYRPASGSKVYGKRRVDRKTKAFLSGHGKNKLHKKAVSVSSAADEMEEISVQQNSHTWVGLNIDVGNPHAVCFLEDLEQVGSLADAPVVNPASSYPEGVNVEFVQILPNNEAKMRVHERGSGETRSCGTGTCAVALAATIHSGGSLPSRWTIYPPGGRLIVDIDGHSNATLIGPAELVREVEIGQYLNS